MGKKSALKEQAAPKNRGKCMKIAIITINDYGNFGNRLQNYALTHILRERFHCETYTLESYKENLPYRAHFVEWLKEQIGIWLCSTRWFSANHRRSNFKRWSKQHIPVKRYYNVGHLPNYLNKEFDRFFVGSDQVWNYHFAKTNFEDTFLTFAENEKKIAVAASFGVDDIPKEKEDYYKNRLSSFKHISVREEAGARIIKRLIGLDVPVLVDPVMMLSKQEWLRVAKKPFVDYSKPYVLKYYLGEKSESEVDVWARENGYDVFTLMDRRSVNLYATGPGEFISLISNADLICSDSYHCIVFSIIFRKPFIVYDRQGKYNNMQSRLHTLLDKFAFQNRWEKDVTEPYYLKCDYSQTDTILMEEQKKFMEYIAKVLSDREE